MNRLTNPQSSHLTSLDSTDKMSKPTEGARTWRHLLLKRILWGGGLLLLLIFTAYTTITFQQARSTLRRSFTTEGQVLQSQQEANQIHAALKKLVVVPDEQPIIATIINAQTLVEQSNFYEHAQNGDKLVIFQNAARTYLYRPQENLIVNVGPLLIVPSTQTSLDTTLPESTDATPSSTDSTEQN